MLEITLISILTLVASAVGTVTGFGTSTIMIPALLFYYPLPQTLLLVGIIHFAGNIWKMLFFKRGLEWKILLLFGIPSIIAAYLGATLTSAFDEEFLQRILGVVLLLYTLFLFFRPSWRIRPTKTMAVTGGVASGFLAGMFGVGGAVRGAFLRAFDLSKESFIFTAAAIALVTDSTRLITYTIDQINLSALLWYGMAIFLPVSLLGSWIGQKIVRHATERTFRMVVTVFLGLSALKFLLFP
ncbi:sulfite exporter TauE/SafE family protein [Candidatus Peregrinibacteria bacterium]|nr:sulfite exporter TauE/SafE family protein [Candidatus Peregrinibacteria bacterium]